MYLSITFIPIIFMFIGCATSRPMNTPSGRPEVTIKNATKKDVTDALVSQMASQGFTIKSVSDYNVVFSKALDSFSAQLLFGSQYDVTPEHRPSFMVVETGDAGTDSINQPHYHKSGKCI